MTGLVPSIVFVFGLVFAAQSPQDDHPFGVPWIEVPDSVHLAQKSQDFDDRPGFWQGDMYFGPDSGALAFRDRRNPVLPGTDYEPVAGILFVQMEGVTLGRICGTGESANAAANCTPLVPGEVTLPAYGDDQSRAAVLQQLQVYYADMNLVVTDERPDEYVPYTMAVVGGTSADAGQGGNVCGIANVACDGRKRNHVSLNFTNCGTQAVQMATIIAQETSHNWGLEHTNNPNDLLYPTVGSGVKSFVDDCMDIDHSTGSAITQCTFVHEYYCAEGGGEQQNSYRELLGVFGPREVDDIPPAIVSTTPEDGAELEEGATFTVSARTEENSRFLGVRWTLVEGPAAVDPITGCTNNMCDIDLPTTVDVEPNEQAWDFIRINGAPRGTYSFLLEIQDAYGNEDSQTFSFTVGDVSSEDGDGDSGMDAGSGEGDGDEEGSGDSTSGPDAEDSDGQCNCRTGRPLPSLAWLLSAIVFALPRRRTSRA